MADFMRCSSRLVWVFLAMTSGVIFTEPAWSQVEPSTITGVVIDDTKAELTGEWKSSTTVRPYLGQSYLHDENLDKGTKSALFSFEVPQTGKYAVLLSYTASSNRDKAVPVTIESADGKKTVKVDQTRRPELGSGFHSLGKFSFTKGTPGRVLIETTGTKAHVIVDGVRLLSEPELAAAVQNEKTPPKSAAKVVKKTPAAEKPTLIAPTFKRQPVSKPLKTISASEVDALFAKHSGQEKPLPLVDDIQFLRRVSLDLVGRQPALEEFRLYLKDQTPNRREKAVERLLASPDFGKNWGNFWSDVIGSRQEEPQLTFLDYKPFRAWLSEEINAGKGWDELVFQMLTAVGKVGENPQATFIGFHQGEPHKLAGETTRVFLSTKIACAQCHAHPFVEMPQETFHGFAAFFARTKVKIAQNNSDGIEITSSDKGEHKMPGAKSSMPPSIFNTQPQQLGMADLDRRERLADWIVSSENPYFARAFVNHIWARLMGRGFYDPVDDMGEMADGQLMELHQKLAEHFIASEFEPRAVFRVITQSQYYQQIDRKLPESKTPFTGATPKKLRGDEVFDSLAVAIELPNLKGKQAPKTAAVRFPPPPKSTRDLVNEAFGYDPSFQDSLINRTMKQAMLMMNNEQILEQLQAHQKSETMLGKLLEAESNDPTVTEVLYARVLSRKPSEREREIVESHLKHAETRAQGFEDLLWSLVNSAEFTTRN